MIKILHIADVHLDSRFVGMSLAESASRRETLRAVFKNALEFADENDCALVLISGDLFDSEYYTPKTLDFLRNCFLKKPNIRFIIAPGNHDPYNRTSPYRFADFPKNVSVFSSEELKKITYPELELTVYGYAFTSPSYPQSPLEGFGGVRENDGFNILCAHTELENSLSPYAPISKRELEACGFDYAALGHIHTRDEIMTCGSTLCAYSGALAGRDFSEYGEKGGVLLTLDRENGIKTARAQRVRFCPWIYKTVSVAIDGATDLPSLGAALAEKLAPLAPTSDTEYIVRLRLSGELPFEINEAELCKMLSPCGVTDIQNDTVYAYSELALEDDFSVRGEFYRILKPMLSSDDPSERRRAALALRLGLKALNGDDIEI